MDAIHVLLVEDNEGDIRLTQEAFRDQEILSKLSVARDGIEALDFVFKRGSFSDAETPDLILLDVNLPLMSGKEVLSTIKQNQSTAHIPVIILTTVSLVESIWDSYSGLAHGYVAKPLEIEDFLEAISNL